LVCNKTESSSSCDSDSDPNWHPFVETNRRTKQWKQTFVKIGCKTVKKKVLNIGLDLLE
jgi:hypothetical protein